MQTIDDLHNSPLAGALWETVVFTEIRKHLALAGNWQLAYWRDRTKEADFLFHRAGHFRIADAKWTENPNSSGKLSLVKKEIAGEPATAIFARSTNPYPLANGTQVIPLADIPTFLE